MTTYDALVGESIRKQRLTKALEIQRKWVESLSDEEREEREERERALPLPPPAPTDASERLRVLIHAMERELD